MRERAVCTLRLQACCLKRGIALEPKLHQAVLRMLLFVGLFRAVFSPCSTMGILYTKLEQVVALLNPSNYNKESTEDVFTISPLFLESS